LDLSMVVTTVTVELDAIMRQRNQRNQWQP